MAIFAIPFVEFFGWLKNFGNQDIARISNVEKRPLLLQTRLQ